MVYQLLLMVTTHGCFCYLLLIFLLLLFVVSIPLAVVAHFHICSSIAASSADTICCFGLLLIVAASSCCLFAAYCYFLLKGTLNQHNINMKWRVSVYEKLDSLLDCTTNEPSFIWLTTSKEINSLSCVCKCIPAIYSCITAIYFTPMVVVIYRWAWLLFR